MTVPPRWNSKEARAPDALRQLLAVAPRPRDLHAHEHAALARQALQLSSGASVGIGGIGGITLAKFVAVGVMVVSAGAAVHWQASHPHHVTAHRTAVHRAAESHARPVTPSPTLVPAESPIAPPVVSPVSPVPTVSLVFPVPPTSTVSSVPPLTIEHHATPVHESHAHVVLQRPAPLPAPTVVAEAPSIQSPLLPPMVSAPHPPAPPQAPAGDLNTLLEARRHLGTDDARALTVLRQHASLYPESQFAPERDFMTVEALLALGRVEEAQQSGASLIAQDPSSPFARRTRRLLSATRILSPPVDSPMQSPTTPQ